jgi:DNA-binding NarL/FixJ family response regulator
MTKGGAMKILLLSDHSGLHMLLQHMLQGREAQAQVWRTHTLASALPYLRQEPEIEAVMLDVTLCGWSRLATLVTTLRPCLDGRKLVLLVDDKVDEALVRAQGVTVDLCLHKTGGVTKMVDHLLGCAAREPVSLSRSIAPRRRSMFMHSTPAPRAFTQRVW